MQEFDVIVIGGGIVGTAIARELSRFKLRTALLEANVDIGAASTKGNGGVTHSGYDPKQGTLKSKINVKGTLMIPKLSKELGFKFINSGTMTLGFEDSDLSVLQKLYKNGLANGVPGIKLIGRDEILKIDKKANPKATMALHAPTAGVVDPFEFAIALAENASENGVEFFRSQKVIGIEKEKNHFVVKTQNNSYKTNYIVNAAGVYGSEVANMVGIYDYEVKPRYGEILVIDKAIGFQLSSVFFPVPGNHTKGVAVIPTPDGNIIVGSTARMTEDKEDVSVTREGISELLKGAKLLVPDIDERYLIREFAGLRPVAINNNDDFVIAASKEVKGFINAIGIQSPGVGAAPAIAEYVMDILSNEGLELKEKEDFNPYRTAIVDFSEANDQEKSKLIKENLMYGNVICRCECVTEAEIVQAIHRPVGATTVDGVKRRVRAGMGRCQGGFCQPKVVSILARELRIPLEAVLLENKNSNIVIGKLKHQEVKG
ncbi:MAG: FAD/NAD(P)-binding oxidoreductase [Firmicutes bacterium HGW-Firmicutes-7]|nr:MAG: FAD/NAD(P)-binding oxidoreductase [Firmicutes bacterium HGW-Firmicutes-7]